MRADGINSLLSDSLGKVLFITVRSCLAKIVKIERLSFNYIFGDTSNLVKDNNLKTNNTHQRRILLYEFVYKMDFGI